MPKGEYTPRILFETTDEILAKVQDLLPKGIRKVVYNVITLELIKILEDHNSTEREMLLKLIMEKKLTMKDWFYGN